MGYDDAETPRWRPQRFMRGYFLVAKDVGDLTRIFCAALEDQTPQAPSNADLDAARLS